MGCNLVSDKDEWMWILNLVKILSWYELAERTGDYIPGFVFKKLDTVQ